MKKIGIAALVLVLTATALTGCRAPSTDETTSPVETNPVMTTPSTQATVPTTQSTQPSASASEPSGGMTMPGIIDGMDGTNGMDSSNPSDNSTGARRSRLPRY